MMMHLKCCADVYVKKVKSALVQSNKCIHVIINCYRHEQKHHAFFFNFVSAGASTHGGGNGARCTMAKIGGNGVVSMSHDRRT